MKKLKSQSGRSMVEMLGVLAIIGVLSVGGIAGYSLSMRRHRANQVVDFASKYAAINYHACQMDLLNGGTYATVSGCDSGGGVAYNQTDLGPLPAGVSKFEVGMVEFSQTGNDYASFYAYFTDKKLCQAVASITGSNVSECDDSNGLIIKIKQN